MTKTIATKETTMKTRTLTTKLKVSGKQTPLAIRMECLDRGGEDLVSLGGGIAKDCFAATVDKGVAVEIIRVKYVAVANEDGKTVTIYGGFMFSPELE